MMLGLVPLPWPHDGSGFSFKIHCQSKALSFKKLYLAFKKDTLTFKKRFIKQKHKGVRF